MELLDRNLLRVALVALTIFAVMSAGVTVATSPRDASFIAAAQRAPVVVGLRLELHRGCLTLAVLAQLRQERYGYSFGQDSAESRSSIDENMPCSLLRELRGITSRQRID